MAVVRFPDRVPNFPQPGGGAFQFGAEFTSAATLSYPGVFFYYVGASGPATVTPTFYNANTMALLATGPAASTAGFPVGWNLIPFSAPLVAPVGNYTAATELPSGDYRFDNAGFLPLSDAFVNVTQGRFAFALGVYPGSFWTGLHGMAVAYEQIPIGGAGNRFMPFIGGPLR